MKKFLPILSAFLLLASCSSSDDDSEKDPTPPVEEAPLVKEGMEMYSQVLIDDRIREESVDKVVNYGNADVPLLFHVNQRHTSGGVDVPAGKADMDCSFYSLTEREHLDFIRLFAIAQGISTTGELTEDQRFEAFLKLSDLLYATRLELALLVYLADDNVDELRALSAMLADAGGSRASSRNGLNSVLAAMIRADIRPSAMLSALEGENISFANLVKRADLSGIDLPAMMRSRAGVTSIVKGVVKGLVVVSKVIIAFIENAQPVVNIESTYASYLHESDLDPLNYYGPRTVNTPKYECRYGTKGAPLAQCIFYIEGYINARHETLPGFFIPRVGMVVERVRASGGMHVEGTMAISEGQAKDGPDGPVAFCDNDITVEYGDCCCFARTARINYVLNAVNGFEKY